MISMQAPDFSLSDQTGKKHTLSDYAGQWLLVYFYPKDDTPGCTTEACNFRDDMPKYLSAGLKIVGISKDTEKSHQKFIEKYDLNFPLLANPTLETIKAYGAWGKKKFMGKEFDGIRRNSYLIDPTGEIVKTYEDVDPKTHSTEILSDFKKLTDE